MINTKKEGIMAAKEGKKVGENPYHEDSPEHWMWMRGWLAYKESIEVKVQ